MTDEEKLERRREYQRESSRRYRERNREAVRERNREAKRLSRAADPEKHKAIAARYRQKNPEKDREYSRRYRQKNPEYGREFSRRYRQENPEKAREAVAKANTSWRERNPERMLRIMRASTARRRARKAVNGVHLVTDRDRRRILSSPCMACGSTDRVTIDHRIPIARGGHDGVGNYAPLCVSCNASKGALTYAEWRYSDRPRAREVFGPKLERSAA